MALADAFDAAFTIKHDTERALEATLNIFMLTDSLSLFDVITKATVTAEKRLLIDLKDVKGAYKRHEISQVGFIRSEFNPADALTKAKRSNILQSILSTGSITHPIEQWVERKK